MSLHVIAVNSRALPDNNNSLIHVLLTESAEFRRCSCPAQHRYIWQYTSQSWCCCCCLHQKYITLFIERLFHDGKTQHLVHMTRVTTLEAIDSLCFVKHTYFACQTLYPLHIDREL